jgi:hypothetical protein
MLAHVHPRLYLSRQDNNHGGICKRVDTYHDRDCHLIDAIWKLGIYDSKQLFDIDAIRMFLQVRTLSDIVDTLGTQITDEAFHGKKLSNWYSSLK